MHCNYGDLHDFSKSISKAMNYASFFKAFFILQKKHSFVNILIKKIKIHENFRPTRRTKSKDDYLFIFFVIKKLSKSDYLLVIGYLNLNI